MWLNLTQPLAKQNIPRLNRCQSRKNCNNSNKKLPNTNFLFLYHIHIKNHIVCDDLNDNSLLNYCFRCYGDTREKDQRLWVPTPEYMNGFHKMIFLVHSHRIYLKNDNSVNVFMQSFRYLFTFLEEVN